MGFLCPRLQSLDHCAQSLGVESGLYRNTRLADQNGDTAPAGTAPAGTATAGTALCCLALDGLVRDSSARGESYGAPLFPIRLLLSWRLWWRLPLELMAPVAELGQPNALAFAPFALRKSTARESAHTLSP